MERIHPKTDAEIIAVYLATVLIWTKAPNVDRDAALMTALEWFEEIVDRSIFNKWPTMVGRREMDFPPYGSVNG